MEVFNMYVPQIAKILRSQCRGGNIPKVGFWKFNYDFDTEEVKSVDAVDPHRRLCTAIVNTFDRHAFRHYFFASN